MKMHDALLPLLILLSLVACDGRKQEGPTQDEGPRSLILKSNLLKLDQRGLSLTYVLLKTVHGNIKFKFYPKKAPNTVTRYMNLVDQGFYNGMLFHKVVPDYLIQTGDPDSGGNGGSGTKLKAEFNSAQHIRGTVAMARMEGDIDSADSQFYIALKTLPHLDGKYTVFAQVTDGFEVLDKIEKGDKLLSISLVFPSKP